jgi:glycosidase
MPWTGERSAGFTAPAVRSWLPLVPDAETRNVATQATDPDSVLATYRRLLGTRRSLAPLRRGTFRLVGADHRDVLAWIREAGGDEVLVAINFGPRPAAVTLGAEAGSGGWLRVDGTHREAGPPIGPDRRVALRPLEAVIATRRG